MVGDVDVLAALILLVEIFDLLLVSELTHDLVVTVVYDLVILLPKSIFLASFPSLWLLHWG